MKLIKAFFLSFLIFMSFVFGVIFYVVNNKVINFSALEQYGNGSPTVLLDDQGHEWARFQIDRRDPVSLDRIPKNLVNALISIEDWKFFQHCGLSFRGILRAIVHNVLSGAKAEGASTITQQLVKLLFFDSKKTFSRKIKEQIYTLLVERQFSKEQILETYLNHVCFGHGVYGVQAACKRFWNKDVSKITLQEAAMLAGNIQRPEKFWPFDYPYSAKKRRDLVLFNMRNLGYISEKEYERAVKTPIILTETNDNNIAPYLKEYIRIFLENLVGKEALYTGGLVVQTTLNRDIQQLANKSFAENIKIIKGTISKDVNGGLISIDVKTGQVKALIGGASFAQSQFNRVFDARRQMGSVFKVILYAEAMQNGKTFADTEVDEPIEVPKNGNSWSPRVDVQPIDGENVDIPVDENIWRPKNALGDFDGKMTLALALSVSNNIIAIKTLLAIGADKVVNLARQFGLPSDQLKPYPSLALGCVDVTLKEATAMFNVFANDGVYVEPYCIKWVKNNLGVKIVKNGENKDFRRVLDSRVSGQVSKVLQLSLKRILKNCPQKWINCEAIGKTGTTNDSRVCWFVGSTPSLTTGVYIGRDDNRPMGESIYPIRTSFPIWIGLNREINFESRSFSYDPSLREICVNSRTGQETLNASDPDAITIFV